MTRFTLIYFSSQFLKWYECKWRNMRISSTSKISRISRISSISRQYFLPDNSDLRAAWDWWMPFKRSRGQSWTTFFLSTFDKSYEWVFWDAKKMCNFPVIPVIWHKSQSLMRKILKKKRRSLAWDWFLRWMPISMAPMAVAPLSWFWALANNGQPHILPPLPALDWSLTQQCCRY